jgi:hypothetical protein
MDLPHQLLRSFYQVGIVQMENDPSPCAMDTRSESDGELRAIVNPYNVPGPHSFKKRLEDMPNDQTMKEPGQPPKLSPKVPVTPQAGE